MPRRKRPCVEPTPRSHGRLKIALGFALAAGVRLVSASDAAAEPARDFLVFEAIADGKCQILSDGGKLVQVRNRHPSRRIRYRFVRYFAEVPQGRSVGVLEPDDAIQKLGCNRVDGRPQRWEVERAQFMGN